MFFRSNNVGNSILSEITLCIYLENQTDVKGEMEEGKERETDC